MNLRLTFKSALPLLFMFAALLFAPSSQAQSAARETISIQSASGMHQFSVEVMRTPDELERGLMFRRFLPDDRGMLFDFHTEAPVMMWMKNTYIPLDMIFTDKTGKITWITENAEPMSEDIISSHGPAYAVLEVNAGTAARLQIKAGDVMKSAIFQ